MTEPTHGDSIVTHYATVYYTHQLNHVDMLGALMASGVEGSGGAGSTRTFTLEDQAGFAGLSVYPSTVCLDEQSDEFEEYVAAKAAGEAQCEELRSALDDVVVYAPRLPRLQTDQTSGLLRTAHADTLAVMLASVRAFSAV